MNKSSPGSVKLDIPELQSPDDKAKAKAQSNEGSVKAKAKPTQLQSTQLISEGNDLDLSRTRGGVATVLLVEDRGEVTKRETVGQSSTSGRWEDVDAVDGIYFAAFEPPTSDRWVTGYSPPANMSGLSR